MPLAENPIAAFLLQYAYEPTIVYSSVVLLLFASSFGLPFPEEIVLLSAGLLAHIGSHPELYPPPSPDAMSVDVATAATVCFFAVLMSDFLVFWLGRTFGTRMLNHRWVQKIIKPEAYAKISNWTARFGPYACGVFRFTPALRFPGHFACGALGIKYSTFLLVDGTAALLTVPTQVILMAHFGEQVLGVLKDVKLAMAIVIGIAAIILIGKRLLAKRSARSQTSAKLGVSSDAGPKAAS
jgi:membrane protein DedA with SNARE-associated domain